MGGSVQCSHMPHDSFSSCTMDFAHCSSMKLRPSVLHPEAEIDGQLWSQSLIGGIEWHTHTHTHKWGQWEIITACQCETVSFVCVTSLSFLRNNSGDIERVGWVWVCVSVCVCVWALLSISLCFARHGVSHRPGTPRVDSICQPLP